LALNSTFDVFGAKWTLKTLINTCNILGLEQGSGQGVQRWTAILNKLPPYLVHSDGALQEWAWPGLTDNYNHRHSSMLLPVWPYREITPEAGSTMYNAAKTLLSLKDGFPYENTGHGYCHASLIAAGLKNATSVSNHLLTLTKNGYYYKGLATSHTGNHGTFFTTDTCNTVPAIMMEMLISSDTGVLELLPAIPTSLNQGSISGVKGRSRFTVQNLSWNLSSKSVTCSVKSDITQSLTLIERKGINTISANVTVSSSPLGSIARVLQLTAGGTANITIGTN